MAVMLGKLHDALLAGGVPPDKAREAAAEVAAYENRLTELLTYARIRAGLLVVLLGSQAALWAEYGGVRGQLSQIGMRVDQIARAVTK